MELATMLLSTPIKTETTEILSFAVKYFLEKHKIVFVFEYQK